MSSSFLRRVCSDMAIYGVAGAAQKASALLLLPLYARVLSPSGYGLFDVTLSAVGIANVLFIMGSDSSVVLLLTRHGRERASEIAVSTFCLVFGWAVILFALGFWLEPYVVQYLPESRPYIPILTFVAVLIPLQISTLLFANFHRWLQNLRVFVAVTLAQLGATVPLTAIFLGPMRLGLKGALLGLIAGYAFAACVGLVATLPFLRTRPKSKLAWECIRLGVPLAVFGIANQALPVTLRAILVACLGLAETGVYAAGNRLALAIYFLVQMFSLAWAPIMLGGGKGALDKTSAADGARWYCGLVALFGGWWVLAAPIAVHVLLGPGYEAAAGITGILIFAASVYGWRTEVLLLGFYATHKVRWVPAFALLLLALYAVLVTPAALGAGIAGAAAAVAVAEIIATLLMLTALERIYPIPIDFAAVASLAVILLSTVIGDQALRSVAAGWQLDISVRFAAAVALPIAVIMARGISVDELRGLFGRIAD
jgi:O-antigen/teichoic acid export membrane protein